MYLNGLITLNNSKDLLSLTSITCVLKRYAAVLNTELSIGRIGGN